MTAHKLDDENIKRLLVKFSLPAVTGMFVMAMYNLVDTIFVGRAVGTLGIAGLSIVFPVQMIVMSVGLLFGIGGASVISRLLGKGDKVEADRAYGNIAFSAVLSGLVLAVIGIVFNEKILMLFGASREIFPFASDYYNIIIFASPLFVTAMTGNNVLRSVGLAKAAMISMITGAASNIILDPVFIFGMGMGVKGAALATVISQSLSVIYLVWRLSSSQCCLVLKHRNLKPDAKLQREIAAIGFSSFIRNVAGSIVFALVNNKLMIYGNEISVAIYGITVRLSRFLIMPLIGIAQGLQPVVGYNFGAGRIDKVKEACKTGIVWGTTLSTTSFIISMILAKPLIGMFSSDPILLSEGTRAFRLMMLGLWGVGFQIVGTTIFQALGKARESLLLSMSREILFFLPALLILPNFLNLTGIWITVPVADVLAFLLTLFMVRRFVKKHETAAGTLYVPAILTD